MTRKQWMKQALADIKSGQPITLCCVMATPERLAAGLCLGRVSNERIHRGQDTCSPDCQADKRRIRREELRMRKCSHCGHGFTKREREQRLAAKLTPTEPVCCPVNDPSCEGGDGDNHDACTPAIPNSGKEDL